ncbi:hypothetical protein ACN9M0_17030 [Streptomyces sp. R-07]|uniref:hypothetical protein n=1 Tax=unclassified Streptomyces TaxID=2593676 RepID=UPI00341413BE
MRTSARVVSVAALPLVALGTAHGIRSERAESPSSTTSVSVVASGPDDNMIRG